MDGPLVSSTPVSLQLDNANPLKMGRKDILPWIMARPFLGTVKTLYRFEGFGTVRFGAATEFY